MDLDGIMDKMAAWFEIESFRQSPENLQTILIALERRPHSFGLILKDGYHLLTLKEEAALDPEELGRSPAYCQLDVTILHQMLEKEFGIDESRAAGTEQGPLYQESCQEAVELVGKGEVLASFLMGPLDVNAVKEVAEAGEKMPQKSTYFYPKLTTGLLLNPLTEQNR